ncbi:MAG: MFS transporter, partial [Candidatus Ranarchaeia archaeon]
GLNVVVPFLGGFLTLISWRLTFFSFIIALPILLAVYFVLPETNPKFRASDMPIGDGKLIGNSDISPQLSSSVQCADLRSSGPNRLTLVMMAVMILGFSYFVTTFGALNLFTAYYVEFGLLQSPVITGLFQTAQSIIALVLNMFMSRLMIRTSKPTLIATAFFLMAGGCGFFIFPPTLLCFAIATVLIGLSMGIAFSVLNAYVLDIAPPMKRGLFTSLFQAFIKFAQTSGPILIGFGFTLSGNQIMAPFSIGLGVSVFAGLLCLPLILHAKKTGIGQPDGYIVPSSI